jgi:hypothetical protein
MQSHEQMPVLMSPEHQLPGTVPDAGLLRSLGRLVRGLSALFWGLPIALIVCVQACVQSIRMDVLQSLNIFPPLVATGWLAFGLWQLGSFQKQERVWMYALDRAKLLAMVNVGLSPFLYWWNQAPQVQFFATVVQVLAVSGLLFLDSLNLLLRRLSAMLPDEALREETRLFTTLNRILVLCIMLLGAALYLLLRNPNWFPGISNYLMELGPLGGWNLLFMVLLPLAITMALTWKIKQAILDSVFNG